MTRGQLKANIKQNLADVGSVFYTDSDLNESLQDAYDDIACLTQCIIRTTTLNWVSELSYYNFKELGISDYLTTRAIFNNITNCWLRDDLNIRDFDKIRRDWELWNGTPQFWAPCSPSRIAIAAKYIASSSSGAFSPIAFSDAYYIGSGGSLGTFVLYYSSIAPTFTSDSETPLVATDMQGLFENYCTADLLEHAQEFIKASNYWELYYSDIEKYKKRVSSLSKSDLLMRV